MMDFGSKLGFFVEVRDFVTELKTVGILQ
jgi:hypothetical protein